MNTVETSGAKGDDHPVLDLSCVVLEVPDYDLIRQERLDRNRQTMEAADRGITKEILPEVDQNSEETKAAVTIQKTFRGFLGRKEYTDKLFAQYEQEEQLRQEKMERQMQEGELLIDNHRLEICLGDSQTVRRNRDRQYLTKIITIQRAWREHLRNQSSKALKKESDSPLTPTNETADKRVASILDSNPQDLSDHDDENSETESAIACAMTLLTPEENQGGGDDSSTAAQNDSEDDLASSLIQDSVGSNPDSEDLSPTLPPIIAPTPGIKPVLDSQEILSGLERDKKSPGRFSVDGECESVVSDYSELGGPLRDIERDVNFMDKDALRTEDDWPLLAEASWNSEEEVLEKREGESETDFERRVRKVNLLSLAQEFAELKKHNSQACPINFHRNQSAKTLGRGSSPFGSRGESLERPNRRSHSKSPLRGIEKTSKSANMSEPGCKNTKTNLPPENKKIANSKTEDLPVNEKRRRDSNSTDDLPANMRPDRCINSPVMARNARTGVVSSQDVSSSKVSDSRDQMAQSSGDFEGDFDVYNIETALPQMNWEMLEKQLQAAESDEKTRLEACKNDREEIRRRLAMATDEDFGYSADDGKEGSDTAALSPRRQKLQARLQGAQSGMQICFMNDDVLDDDEDDAGNIEEEKTEEEEEENSGKNQSEPLLPPHPNHPCYPGEIEKFTNRQTQLQTEATLALAQASTMARMQLEVEKQGKKKSPIADMVGIPTLGNGRRLRLHRNKLQEMNIGQLQVLVNDLHSQIELLNEDLVHLLIERDDLHMEQDSMLVDIEDLTSHCHDPKATNNNKSTQNKNRPTSRRDRHK